MQVLNLNISLSNFLTFHIYSLSGGHLKEALSLI